MSALDKVVAELVSPKARRLGRLILIACQGGAPAPTPTAPPRQADGERELAQPIPAAEPENVAAECARFVKLFARRSRRAACAVIDSEVFK
jgi:hypothetical protein